VRQVGTQEVEQQPLAFGEVDVATAHRDGDHRRQRDVQRDRHLELDAHLAVEPPIELGRLEFLPGDDVADAAGRTVAGALHVAHQRVCLGQLQQHVVGALGGGEVDRVDRVDEAAGRRVDVVDRRHRAVDKVPHCPQRPRSEAVEVAGIDEQENGFQRTAVVLVAEPRAAYADRGIARCLPTGWNTAREKGGHCASESVHVRPAR